MTRNLNDKYNRYYKKYNKMRQKKKTNVFFLNKSITPIDINYLNTLNTKSIIQQTKMNETPHLSCKSKHEVISIVLKKQNKLSGLIYFTGILEIIGHKFGYLRDPKKNYQLSCNDIYISPKQIKLFNLKSGDIIRAQIRGPKYKEVYPSVLKIYSINKNSPRNNSKFAPFSHLIPVYPRQKLTLERSSTDYSTRLIDLFCPIGKGQRTLIVSPPRSGKTILLQKIANSIALNYPKVVLLMLLVDERPEEVTDMRRCIKGHVFSSTFDQPPNHHVQLSELVLNKAKRLVERKQDVVLFLDSITRLGRAYNNMYPSNGKLLSGGIDSSALSKPKSFFGSARNVENGGSLTIIATALVQTGSRMDEVIFEEFKGTGNSEIVLDRKLMEKRIFPCMDINKSGTRKEEYILSPNLLNKIWIIRQLLYPLNVISSLNFILKKIKGSKNNLEFIQNIKV